MENNQLATYAGVKKDFIKFEENYLNENEKIIVKCMATIGKIMTFNKKEVARPGVLILTSKRVVFYGRKSMNLKEILEIIMPDSIMSIENKTYAMPGWETIKIETSEDIFEFNLVKKESSIIKDELKRLVNSISEDENILNIGKILTYNGETGVGKILLRTGNKIDFNVDLWSSGSEIPKIDLDVVIKDNGEITPYSNSTSYERKPTPPTPPYTPPTPTNPILTGIGIGFGILIFIIIVFSVIIYFGSGQSNNSSNSNQYQQRYYEYPRY